MPRISDKKKVIPITSSESWTILDRDEKDEENADFCLHRCPHEDTPCNGDCPEMKAFRKNNRRK